MRIQDSFHSSCERNPAKVALVCAGERVTYGEVALRVRALAALLYERGVKPGDRVVVFLDTCVEFAIAIHAVLDVGAVFVPVSVLTKPDKLAYMLNDTRASALVAHRRQSIAWTDALSRNASVTSCVIRDLAPTSGPADPRLFPWPEAVPGAAAQLNAVETGDRALAAIIYTSGTTGVPKGVMLSHRNMLSAWRSVQAYLAFRENDVIGLALVPSFSYGLYHVLIGLGIGATIVLERTAAFPAEILAHFADEKITVLPGVPTLFSAILALENLESFDLSALRIITNAASALPEEHIVRLRRRFPSAELFSMYGMTECKRVSYLSPDDLGTRPSSVGRGMPFQEIWLADDAGSRLPPGSTGELVVSGEHVMQGYWEKTEETAQRLRVDETSGRVALYSGDIFRTDADGYLYFVARKDDIIKSRGEKVSPREVENAIYSLDGVRDCAVIGVPDAALGQAVKAFVVLSEGRQLSERDVIKHCLKKLESFMAPRSVVFMKDLPRTDSGKIRKVDLR